MIVTFAPYPGGIAIWQNGKLAVAIPQRDLLRLVEVAARAAQHDVYAAPPPARPFDLSDA